MRDILFRGKRLDNGEWIIGGNISVMTEDDGSTTVLIAATGSGMDCVCVEFGNVVAVDACDLHTVDPLTVGQFTGLLDKNGKKIFEGDVLKPLMHDRHTWIVGFEGGAFVGKQSNVPGLAYWEYLREVFEANTLTTIGTIHDKEDSNK